jgi:hypothetical protein
MARRYADIQAEHTAAQMVPHIAILKITIEEQENLLAAREPGFNPDDYGVMVDRLSRMMRTFFKPPRQSRYAKVERLSAEAHAALLRGQSPRPPLPTPPLAQAAKRPSLSPAASLSPGNPITIRFRRDRHETLQQTHDFHAHHARRRERPNHSRDANGKRATAVVSPLGNG